MQRPGPFRHGANTADRGGRASRNGRYADTRKQRGGSIRITGPRVENRSAGPATIGLKHILETPNRGRRPKKGTDGCRTQGAGMVLISRRSRAPRLVAASRDGEEPSSPERGRFVSGRCGEGGAAHARTCVMGGSAVVEDLQRHSPVRNGASRRGFAGPTGCGVKKWPTDLNSPPQTPSAQLRGKSWAPQRFARIAPGGSRRYRQCHRRRGVLPISRHHLILLSNSVAGQPCKRGNRPDHDLFTGYFSQ